MGCDYQFYRPQTWLIIFVVLLQIVFAEQQIEESCTVRRTLKSGQCKLLSNCPQALDALRLHGISPQICRFEGVLPVICCVDNSTAHSTQEGIVVSVGNKSKQKCKEYGEHATTISPLSPKHATRSCEFFHPQLVIGGNKARPKEFPHLAAIGYDGEIESKKEWLCTGALISENFVLTSGHCLYNYQYGEAKYIRIGDLILDTDEEDSMPQEFDIVEIIRHPNFTKPSMHHNIALLKMNQEVKINSYVRPACLPAHPTVLASKAVIAGLARESYAPKFSTHLLKETLHIFSSSECQIMYKYAHYSRLKNNISDATQFCAGSFPRHTCVMGPGVLQVYHNEVDCMYSIVGIAAFDKACGTAYVPDVFTRVSAYTDWIEGIVWPS